MLDSGYFNNIVFQSECTKYEMLNFVNNMKTMIEFWTKEMSSKSMMRYYMEMKSNIWKIAMLNNRSVQLYESLEDVAYPSCALTTILGYRETTSSFYEFCEF